MKKLLALLIAVMMVVALVPAAVLSAMVPASDSQQGGVEGEPPVPPVSPEDTAPSVSYVITEDPADDTDERVEEGNTFNFDLEFTEGEDKFEIVNKDDVLVGYFKDLASADAWLRNGDTLRFLADWTISTRYNFGAARTQFAKTRMAYTIDGNGHALIYTGADDTAVTYAYALGFTGNDAGHDITLAGLKIVSARGCIEAAPGTGQGLRLTVDNSQLYANDAYYFVDRAFYAANGLTFAGDQDDDAVAGRTVNTFIVFKGENTRVYANKGNVVYACSVITVYDGVYYSTGGQTFYVTGDQNYAHRTDHKLIFYGGTVVNDTLTAVRIRGGASCFIFGGNFVQTAERSTDAWSTAIRCGTGDTMNKEGDAEHGEKNISQVYIMGGNFYTDVNSASGLATKVPTEGCVQSCVERGLVYVANAKFHYTGAKAYGGVADKTIFSAASIQTTADAAANCSLTVPSALTSSGFDTVTWAKEMTITFDAAKYGDAVTAEGKIADADALYAATGCEAAILDAEGKVIDLVNVDAETDNSIHKGTRDAMLTAVDEKLAWSTLMTPDGGTYFLLSDITSPQGNGDTDLYNQVAGGHIFIDGNGHTISVENKGYYFCYTNGGGNITFKNVTLINPTGRVLQYGSDTYFLSPEWTLAENAKVISGAGSAVYLQSGAIFTMLEGSSLECLPVTEQWNYAVQMTPNTTFNLKGGVLHAFVSNGLNGSGEPVARHNKGIFFMTDAAGVHTINLISGEIHTVGDGLSALYVRNEACAETSLVNLTLMADVELYDMTNNGKKYEAPNLSGDAATVTPAGGEPVSYATLYDAVRNAKDGDTVSLLRDEMAYKHFEIRKSIVINGNGHTVYDMYGAATLPMVYVTGDQVNVEIHNLTLVTVGTGIYVSPNTFANRNSASADLNANDLKDISLLLDNCRVYAGVSGASAFDIVNSGEETTDLIATALTAGALLMHGEGVYVKITGENSAVMAANNEAVINYGGFLDIYGGTFYAHTATQAMWLRGRLGLTKNADDQMENATTSIYGGSFIAGPFVSMSVARSAQGHTMVVAGGEFLMMEGATDTLKNYVDRQTIRVSESSISGYLYILGGNFYNTSSVATALGCGQVNVAYINISGGNFFTNYYNPADTLDRNLRIENVFYSTHTFSIAGATNAFGMQIYDAYEVKNFDREEVPAYAANTKLAYVKEHAFTHLQAVSRNEQWLAQNGYLEEGISYIVTDGNGGIPTSFYSFELERAMMYLGNGGTFTLTRDVTVRMPGKNTTGATKDTNYGVSMRCRPGVGKVLINSAAVNGYYTLTLSSTESMMFSARGGYLHFDNIGLVNPTGRVLSVEGPNTTLRFTDGYYSAYDTVSDSHNCDTISLGNVHGKVVLLAEGGTFTSNKAAFAIANDNSYVSFGVEGTKQGPTIIMNGAQGVWVGSTNNLTMNVYYMTFDDIGTGGQNFYFDKNNSKLAFNVYDGYFYVNNKGNAPVIQSANSESASCTMDVNIYGGTFLRGNTGPGSSGYGKVLIFSHDGTVNLYGGTFRTLVSGNTMMSIRENTVTVTIGVKETGEGPTIQTNGGYGIQIDSSYGTTATLNVYGGTFKGSGTNGNIYMGEDKEDGTAKVSATLHIYGGSFETSANVLTVGSGDTAYVHNGTFKSGSSGNMFVTNVGSKLYIENGTYTKTGGYVYTPGKDSVLNVTGGTFNSVGSFAFYNGADTFTINLGAMGAGNDSLSLLTNNGLLGLPAEYTGHAIVNVYGGTYRLERISGSPNMIYIYGEGTGEFKLYDGNFWQSGPSRMFRIGGDFNGSFDVYGGTYEQTATSDLIVVTDNSFAHVTIGREDGTGPVMVAHHTTVLEYSTSTTVTTPAKIRILGGHFTVKGGDSSAFDLGKMPAGSTVVFEKDVTVVMEESSIGYAVNFNSDGNTCTINGGSYYTYGNSDATVSCGNGTMTIYAGYFYGSGLCVARAIGGKASSYNTPLDEGEIVTEANALLVIYGGIFTQANYWVRNERTDGWYNDAVILAGGATGYGTVELNGGTYIANSGVGHYVINKYNPASTIRINGGIFMAGEVQQYYFKSMGELLDKDTGEMICGPDPKPIPVNREKDLQLNYGDKVYFIYMLGAEEEISYVKVTNAAEIRISTFEMGEQDGYISGLRFTSTISASAIAQFKQLTGAATVDFGTLIVPKDYLANGVAFTHEALTAAGLDFLDIAAKDSLVIDAQGNATFTAAIIEILPENYGRDFIAVGYMKAKVAAPITPDVGDVGSVAPELVDTYTYADYDEGGVSLAELATALLENEINAAHPYSDDLRALLQSFADALPEDDGTDTPNVPTLPGDGDDVIDDPFGSDDDDDDDNNGGDDGNGDGDGDGDPIDE